MTLRATFYIGTPYWLRMYDRRVGFVRDGDLINLGGVPRRRRTVKEAAGLRVEYEELN